VQFTPESIQQEKKQESEAVLDVAQIQEMSKDDCKLSPESEEELKTDLKRKHYEERNNMGWWLSLKKSS